MVVSETAGFECVSLLETWRVIKLDKATEARYLVRSVSGRGDCYRSIMQNSDVERVEQSRTKS